MNDNSKISDETEITIAQVREKFSSAVDRVNYNFFRLIQFAIRNVILIVLLIIVGAGLGIYLDRTQKTYDHEIIVRPNFGSVDYVYTKINLLEAKIKERDTAFLKAIGIKYPKKLTSISIKPIVDLYPFITGKEQNFELLKLMSENGDIKKIAEEEVTSKNYPTHLLLFSTKGRTDVANTLQPILNYLNNSEFFTHIKGQYVKNVQLKIAANERTIAQINGLLDAYGSGNVKNPAQVYINENNQLNDVIESKNDLVQENGELRIEQVTLDKIVKEFNVILNMENTASTNGKMKLVLPLFFIAIFIAIKLFRNFYRSQKRKLIIPDPA